MSYVELQAEIQALQAQLDAIQQREEEQKESEEGGTDLTSILESHSPEQLIKRLKRQLKKNGEEFELNEQLQDLITALENELEQLPPKACLLVFSAGVVFGKVLS